MILGDSEIKRMMAEGYFPAYPKLLINPASMNVRIGASFLVPRRKWFGSVALGDEVKYKKIVLQKGKAFKLRPGQFALATTIESISPCRIRISGRGFPTSLLMVLRLLLIGIVLELMTAYDRPQ